MKKSILIVGSAGFIGHALAGRLTPAETRLLSAQRWSIAAIVLWEIAKLAELGHPC